MNEKVVSSTQNWTATCRRYVCFIDIMGFKNMVATKSHSEILTMMEHIVTIQNDNAGVPWNDKGGLVKTSTYSDSIIIYSRDDSPDSLESIICTASGIINDLLNAGIPYKGALAAGNMTCDFEKSIYFGQPLIDAFLLQEELYFYGLVAHGSIEKDLEEHGKIPFIFEYNCPLKKGRSKHLTIEPMYVTEDREDKKELSDKLFQSVERMKHSTSGSLRIYIDSTIEYLEAC